jgi:hypothetical protein
MTQDGTGRARHLARRTRVRSDIPSTVGLPKFLNPSEITAVSMLRQLDPSRSWDSIIQEIIENSSLDGKSAKSGD